MPAAGPRAKCRTCDFVAHLASSRAREMAARSAPVPALPPGVHYVGQRVLRGTARGWTFHLPLSWVALSRASGGSSSTSGSSPESWDDRSLLRGLVDIRLTALHETRRSWRTVRRVVLPLMRAAAAHTRRHEVPPRGSWAFTSLMQGASSAKSRHRVPPPRATRLPPSVSASSETGRRAVAGGSHTSCGRSRGSLC